MKRGSHSNITCRVRSLRLTNSFCWRRCSMNTAPLFCKPTTRHIPLPIRTLFDCTGTLADIKELIAANHRTIAARWPETISGGDLLHGKDRNGRHFFTSKSNDREYKFRWSKFKTNSRTSGWWPMHDARMNDWSDKYNFNFIQVETPSILHVAM